MAGISEIGDLQARKRALVAQSEKWRETLKAEAHALALCGNSLRKRVDQARSIGPWLLLGLPLVAPLVGLLTRGRSRQNHSAPPSKAKGGLATVLLGYRLYRKYAPMVRSLLTHLSRQRKRGEYRSPAANI